MLEVAGNPIDLSRFSGLVQRQSLDEHSPALHMPNLAHVVNSEVADSQLVDAVFLSVYALEYAKSNKLPTYR